MDALTHSIEALTSARQNPYSDAVAMGSIQLSIVSDFSQSAQVGIWM